ncbi:MAG TPA: RDD family protein [Cyclobacteriaceae bacterium]|nr:RDD family protein [Cyclobacteriaceae bacterium]
MNQILDAPVTAVAKMEYAGFWIRFVAAFIDGIVLGVVNWIIGFALIGGSLSLQDPFALGGGIAAYYLVSWAIRGAYFSFFESSERQATLGKMAVGIKVADENGQRLTFANALGRWASAFISWAILMIGFIMAGFDAKKQALHDKIAKTVVYYG